MLALSTWLSLVLDSLTQISSTDPLEACLAHFDTDFDDDTSIRENAFLDSIPLMDVPNEIAIIEPLHDVESTLTYPKSHLS